MRGNYESDVYYSEPIIVSKKPLAVQRKIMTLQIIHNPRCSKSRQTLALIEEHNVEVDIVLYLESPLNKAQLKKICLQLDLAPQQIIRFKEDIAKELGLKASDARKESEWLDILTQHPKLLERPIVSDGKKAIIGRPPENVLALI